MQDMLNILNNPLTMVNKTNENHDKCEYLKINI